VVIKPRTIPKLSSSTLATGARQFVVQLAFEMIRSLFFSTCELTPSTIMFVDLVLAGTVNSTRPAPAVRVVSPDRSAW